MSGPASDAALTAVVTVVRELLDDPNLGPTDDFYAVGGHSLLIVRVLRTLRLDYGLELDARSFAVNSQLAALAAACRSVPSGNAQR